ncbi:hypothetical protein IAT40_004273 [Kwoniella sp. CBS 6097]
MAKTKKTFKGASCTRLYFGNSPHYRSTEAPERPEPDPDSDDVDVVVSALEHTSDPTFTSTFTSTSTSTLTSTGMSGASVGTFEAAHEHEGALIAVLKPLAITSSTSGSRIEPTDLPESESMLQSDRQEVDLHSSHSASYKNGLKTMPPRPGKNLLNPKDFQRLEPVHELIGDYLLEAAPVKMLQVNSRAYHSSIPRVYTHLVLDQHSVRPLFERLNKGRSYLWVPLDQPVRKEKGQGSGISGTPKPDPILDPDLEDKLESKCKSDTRRVEDEEPKYNKIERVGEDQQCKDKDDQVQPTARTSEDQQEEDGWTLVGRQPPMSTSEWQSFRTRALTTIWASQPKSELGYRLVGSNTLHAWGGPKSKDGQLHSFEKYYGNNRKFDAFDHTHEITFTDVESLFRLSDEVRDYRARWKPKRRGVPPPLFENVEIFNFGQKTIDDLVLHWGRGRRTLAAMLAQQATQAPLQAPIGPWIVAAVPNANAVAPTNGTAPTAVPTATSRPSNPRKDIATFVVKQKYNIPLEGPKENVESASASAATAAPTVSTAAAAAAAAGSGLSEAGAVPTREFVVHLAPAHTDIHYDLVPQRERGLNVFQVLNKHLLPRVFTFDFRPRFFATLSTCTGEALPEDAERWLDWMIADLTRAQTRAALYNVLNRGETRFDRRAKVYRLEFKIHLVKGQLDKTYLPLRNNDCRHFYLIPPPGSRPSIILKSGSNQDRDQDTRIGDGGGDIVKRKRTGNQESLAIRPKHVAELILDHLRKVQALDRHGSPPKWIRYFVDDHEAVSRHLRALIEPHERMFWSGILEDKDQTLIAALPYGTT